jgi:hypothetical protein
MASPGSPSRRELQLLADSNEQWQLSRFLTEIRRPLRAQLAEIVVDGMRAAQATARLEAALRALPSSHVL